VHLLPFLRLNHITTTDLMKKLQGILAFSILLSGVLIVGCADKLKDLDGTKWTLEEVTTEHGQKLYPTGFYSVDISGENLAIQLDVNKCRGTYSVVGKNKINITERFTCTRMCCDSDMAEAFLEDLSGDFEVETSDEKLILTGQQTFVFRKWSKNDVKRENNEAYLKIKRTGCFGACPIYEMTLFSDGSSLYTGKRFVAVNGKQSHEFEATRIKGLLKRANKIDFTTLQPLYDDPSISDMESIYIEHNGTTVKVRYKPDVPKELLTLIDDVHACAVDAGWVKE